MGNEMGNNNVTGLQASEECANGFDKTMERPDRSPGLNNTNDKKDGSQDLDMSESLKEPIIPNGEGEQKASDQKNPPTKNEDLDEKNGGSLQDHTSAQDDDQNSDETHNEKATEVTTNTTETIAPVGTTIEDMTSNKDISTSDEKFKQLVQKITERSEESTIANHCTLLEENTEGSPEDEEESCNHEVAVVGDNLVGEDTVQNLEGHTGVSTVEDISTPSPIQGETTSSTESIITDYLDAEIKEVVIEDEPRERDNSSYLQPEDDTKQETSKNDNAGTPEEKEEICEMSKTTTVETVIESDVVLEEDKKIHRLENQEEDIPKCSASGALDSAEVLSRFQSSLADPRATNDREFQKHELNKSIVAAGQISDSVSATVEHNVIERTDTEQEGIVAKTVAVQNLADNFEGEKKSYGIHDFVSLVDVNRKCFTGLDPPLSDPLPILNEEKVQLEAIVEELDAPATATSPALQLEDFVKKRDIKFDSSDSNEGTITSTQEAKTIDTQETMDSSQCDQLQQVLLEEPEVVKFENSETLGNCMELAEYSSMTGLIFPNGSTKDTEGASAAATCFTFESSQEKVTVTVGFTAESKHKVTTNADKSSEERCLLQTPTLGRDAGEETPLLQSAENINSLSYYTEQHGKVVDNIPMTDMALMQDKDEAEKESEKSPLLSPREPSEGDFIAPKHSAGNKKPLHTLITEDRVGMCYQLKEQEAGPKNSTTLSSPRSKGKQKPRSSPFASCMCCTTSTN